MSSPVKKIQKKSEAKKLDFTKSELDFVTSLKNPVEEFVKIKVGVSNLDESKRSILLRFLKHMYNIDSDLRFQLDLAMAALKKTEKDIKEGKLNESTDNS